MLFVIGLFVLVPWVIYNAYVMGSEAATRYRSVRAVVAYVVGGTLGNPVTVVLAVCVILLGLRLKKSKSKMITPLKASVFLAVLFLVIGCDDFSGFDRVYGNSDPQPTECDFLRAPIGKKACHYERAITTEIVWKLQPNKLSCATSPKGLLPVDRNFARVMLWSDHSFVEWEDCTPDYKDKDIGVIAYVGYKKVEDR